MAFALIKRSDTFFKREKGLVDFGSINPGLFFHVCVICSPFVSCQVDEGDFAKKFFSVFE